MPSDPSVITYHDVTLHRSDVALLDGENWLNDNIISFFYDYLTHDVFNAQQKEVLFVHPSTAFMVAFVEEASELKVILKDLYIESKSLIFMPINNCRSIDSAGGSHWSLLMFDRKKNKFSYYDSCGTSNLQSAKLTANKITPILNLVEPPEFVVEEAPQQQNGSDCGVYVLALTRFLGQQIQLNVSSSSSLAMNTDITPTFITTLRKEIKNQITSLQLSATKMV